MIRATSRIVSNVDDIEVEIAFTMPVREWDALRVLLADTAKWPSTDFKSVLRRALEKVNFQLRNSDDEEIS